MAEANSTAPNNKQLMVALNEIAFIADIIDSLHFHMNEENAEAITLASRQLAKNIGAIADRVNDFPLRSPDSWLLPPTFENNKEHGG